MKKILSLLAFVFLCTNLFAYDFEKNGIYYNLLGGDSVAITHEYSNNYYEYDRHGGYSGSINIPEKVEYNSTTYHVTTIGDEAFFNCSGLTAVTIPNSVTTIGEYAFFRCSSLTAITIPNSVTIIGISAFNQCSSLTAITIPDSVTAIANAVFYCCSSLTEVTIPNNVTAIGESAFNGCSTLTSITIPNSITTISDEAFAGCSSLTEVTIPNNVTAIGESAFNGCSTLTSITIPNSVTSISDYAFCNCSGLTSVTIPNSVTSIGEGAFNGCSTLTSITIPNSITTISDEAFAGCSSLTEVTIPNNVTAIGSSAFADCTGLTSIIIPKATISISKNTFLKCSGLTSITVEEGNLLYHSKNNCLINRRTKELVLGCKTSTIPDDGTVTSIGESAFNGCVSLTSMIIPNTINSIGRGAFLGCAALTNVVIPESVTLLNEYVFYNCSSLTSITLPKTITGIKEWAFSGCTALTEITIPNDVDSLAGTAFRSCSNLKTIYWNAIDYDYWDAYNNNDNDYYDWHISVNGEINHPFTNLPIQQFIFGENVRSIPAYLCSNCSGVKSINIPNTIESIGYQAFSGCASIDTVNYMGTIDSWCTIEFDFGDNDDKWNSYFDDDYSATPLYHGADFYINNTKVTDVVLNKTSIGQCFRGCTSIQNVIFSSSVTSVSSYAFNGCTSLTTVTSKNTIPPSLGSNAFPLNTKIIVPCGCAESYWENKEWAKYLDFNEAFLTDWSAVSVDEAQGTVSITKSPSTCDDNTATFAAIPASGYKFKAWSDGNSDNPRTVAITDAITYTAHFINENNVDGVSLDVRQLNLYTNNTYQLTATITPVTALNKNVTWNSENTDVASVDANGLVTAHSSGTTYIIVTTEDGGFTAYCEVNVTTPITSLAFKQSHITLEVGDLDYLNLRLTPANADKGTFVWSSDNTDVVSVADGYITAHQIGTATVTVNAIDYRLAATCEIAVVAEGQNAEDGVVVDPASQSVNITWSAVDGAAYYVFVVYADETQATKICTLTFDAHGRLINLHFLPKKPAANQEESLLNFTVTGLQPNTTYGYSMNSYTEEETIITSKAGQFTTTSDTATGVETLYDNVSTEVHKVFENGTIYIIRNGEKYTIDGIRVM